MQSLPLLTSLNLELHHANSNKLPNAPYRVRFEVLPYGTDRLHSDSVD